MNPASTTLFTDPIDALSGRFGDLFVNFGSWEMSAFAVIVFVYYVVTYGLSGGLLQFLFRYAMQLLIVKTLLKYYFVPGLFGSPYSIHAFFPAAATYIERFIGQAQTDTIFANAQHMLVQFGLQGGGNLLMVNWAAALDVLVLKVILWGLSALAYASIAMSYGLLEVCELLWPIFIPWLLIPAVRHICWNVLQSIFQYSLYRVAAAAVLFVIAATLSGFEINLVHNDYSLANLAVIIPKLIAVAVADVWMILRIGAVVSDIAKGASSAGSNFIGSVTSTVSLGAIAVGRR